MCSSLGPDLFVGLVMGIESVTSPNLCRCPAGQGTCSTTLQNKLFFKVYNLVTSLLRLAGVMAELIEENEPTPLRKFLLNVQWGIRYIIRATPLLCAQKRK